MRELWENKTNSIMSYNAKVDIDLQEAFDSMSRIEQGSFIEDNLYVIDEDYLVRYLESKGYEINNE